MQEMETATINMRVLLTKKFLSCIDECICQLLPVNQDILIRFKQVQTLHTGRIFTFSGVGAFSSTTIGEGSAGSTAGGGELGGDLGGDELDGDLGGDLGGGELDGDLVVVNWMVT